MSDDGDRRNRPWRPGLNLAEYVDGLMEKNKPRPKYKKLQAYKARLAKQKKEDGALHDRVDKDAQNDKNV